MQQGQLQRLLLSHRFGRASSALADLLAEHGGVDALPDDPQLIEHYLPPGLKGQALPAKPLLEQQLADLQRDGWRLLALGDPDYPPLLASISDPPGVLFVRGDPGCLVSPQLAMVGARGASPEGLGNARQFAREFAAAGFVITSGLAYGIDAAAHQGALQAGRTIAVMATGPDLLYPARHRRLAEQIVEQGGALVTEFPPGCAARKDSFPQRNRIVSGLSLAVIVVEAALRSGSLITARLGGEQGREVFALPGSLHNPLSRGCHKLLREGANWLENGEDLLALFPSFTALADSTLELRAPDHPVLACFTSGLNTLDQLEQRSGMPVSSLTETLTTLELDGLVARLPGGYART